MDDYQQQTNLAHSGLFIAFPFSSAESILNNFQRRSNLFFTPIKMEIKQIHDTNFTYSWKRLQSKQMICFKMPRKKIKNRKINFLNFFILTVVCLFKKSKVYNNKHFPVIKIHWNKIFQLFPYTRKIQIYFSKKERGKKNQAFEEFISTKNSDE